MCRLPSIAARVVETESRLEVRSLAPAQANPIPSLASLTIERRVRETFENSPARLQMG